MDFGAEQDGEIVRRVAGGQRAAEAELVRRFAPRARTYGLRHLRDGELARDLAQAVMMTTIVAVREGRVEEPDHIDRFVLGTCRNVARRMRVAGAKSEAVDPATFDLEPAPAAEVIDRRAISDCLSKLDKRDFMVVMMSFHAGAPADDIAGALGTTAANVRVLRHRALAQLRRCLDRPEARRR